MHTVLELLIIPGTLRFNVPFCVSFLKEVAIGNRLKHLRLVLL